MRWYGVYFGGIDEIDFGCQGVIELGMGICFSGLFVEGYGVEVDFWYDKIVVVELVLMEWVYCVFLEKGMKLGLIVEYVVNQYMVFQYWIEVGWNDGELVFVWCCIVCFDLLVGSGIGCVEIFE